MSEKPILPGESIGILGSGQLGRMLALAARRMGYRVHCLSPESDSPTGQVADWEVVAPYSDYSAIRDFAMSVDVITFEFENIPAETLNIAAQFAPVRPDSSALQVTQNRLREKTFLRNRGFPVTPFASIGGYQDLQESASRLSLPAIIKTSGYGYDGKGQQLLKTNSDLEDMRLELGRMMEPVSVPGATSPHYIEMPKHILEAFVDYECEISVVIARGLDGGMVHYGPVRNDHVNHILDVTTYPAAIHPTLAEKAVELAREIAEALAYVGVMCVEMFLVSDGSLLINELAPRPHNSGHWTIEACPTSQFEQQLRAVCGLPLGAVEPARPAAMANILGDLWAGGEPEWAAALAFPDAHLHLYGKETPRPRRKMGHLTVLADTPEEAEIKARQARAALTPFKSPTRDLLTLLREAEEAEERGTNDEGRRVNPWDESETNDDDDLPNSALNAASNGNRESTHLRWEETS